jgi:hypothetical protein
VGNAERCVCGICARCPAPALKPRRMDFINGSVALGPIRAHTSQDLGRTGRLVRSCPVGPTRSHSNCVVRNGAARHKMSLASWNIIYHDRRRRVWAASHEVATGGRN